MGKGVVDFPGKPFPLGQHAGVVLGRRQLRPGPPKFIGGTAVELRFTVKRTVSQPGHHRERRTEQRPQHNRQMRDGQSRWQPTGRQ